MLFREFGWKNGSFVDDRPLDLPSGEIAGAGEVGAFEVCPIEIDVTQICAAEIRVRAVGAAEICAFEIGAAEIGATDERAAEIDPERLAPLRLGR